MRINGETKGSLKSFLIELILYAFLVFAYFSLVLTFLGDWLQRIYHAERKLYAALALVLIVCQGIMLEAVTSLLLRLIRRGREGE